MKNGLISELSELMKKADKYDNLKERNLDLVNKLEQIKVLIINLQNELQPYRTIGNGKRGPAYDYTATITEIYEKMQSGLEVSVEFIENTYSLDKNRVARLFNKLKAMPKVITRKEGVKAFLYFQKPI